jgi:hypothetical protein
MPWSHPQADRSLPATDQGQPLRGQLPVVKLHEKALFIGVPKVFFAPATVAV